MKTRLLLTMAVLFFLSASCIRTTPKNNNEWSSEEKLRDIAHEFSCITVNEFMNYEHDFVYEKELPSFILIEKAVLEDVCETSRIKGFDKINWIGDGSINDFKYYAIFRCSTGCADVFYAYMGINEETADHIYKYISPKDENFSYFYSPIIVLVDGVNHKKSIINRRYAVKGELLYIFNDEYIASEWFKESMEK